MSLRDVAVLGVGMTRFGVYPARSGADLAREAGLAALRDAGIGFGEVGEAYVGYIFEGPMAGIKAMKEFGLTGLPVSHVENASATGLVAFRDAAWAVASGRCDVAMALGFDKMSEAARRTPRNVLGRDALDSIILPAAYFSLWAVRRMHERGTKPAHFAKIAAKNWNNGALNPLADRQPEQQVTPEQVLASRKIAEPVTAMMTCPVDDGAACAVLARTDLAQRLQPDRPLVRVLASALQTETYAPGHVFMGPVVGPASMTRDTTTQAYEQAGLGPEDVDLVLVHDAFANEELEYYELMGFCPEGDGEKLVEEGQTRLGGRIPFNTDGGLIARGHPGGPTGLAQIHELVRQLRGEAERRQVEGARTGVAQLVGGGSVCAVSVLQRD
ncbi:MAG: thiolase family protein [Myxococcota bacterium]